MSLSKSYCEPVFLISEVSKILDIHPQTLRQYEREGFIKPSRTNGKIRLYSQEDIEKIKHILELTRACGINLAGVNKILELELEVKQLKLKVHEFHIESIEIIKSCKSLVVKKSQYDIVVFDDNIGEIIDGK